MTKHAYVVLVMKAAIADLEDLREKAWAVAPEAAVRASILQGSARVASDM
jgi:hypothetical protein